MLRTRGVPHETQPIHHARALHAQRTRL